MRAQDYIYSDQDFDSSPIVLEQSKLVFFTTGNHDDVIWRQLFRRMMSFEDWNNVSNQFDGLKYLKDYDIETASDIMSSSNYTRAIFVQDPKRR